MIDPRRAILLFLVIAFVLSTIFYLLIVVTGKPSPLYVTGLMWCPGLGAVLTCILLRRKLTSLGWGWRPGYQLVGYLIPLIYCLIASAVIWISGLGGFPNMDFVMTAAPQLGLESLPTAVIITAYVVLTGIIGMVSYIATALGEEIGWRGLLVPELAKFTSFTTTAILSGAIWAVWHYPITPTIYAGWATPTWYWMSCFTIAAIAISFALTWLRLVSGSLWPCVFLHASHNLFMQSIFTPLTYDTGITKYIAGDLGAASAVVALVVAFIFWRKRSEAEAYRPQGLLTIDTRHTA